MNRLRRGPLDEGATGIEYGLLLGLLAVVVLAGVTLFGERVGGVFSSAGAKLGTASSSTSAPPEDPFDFQVLAGGHATYSESTLRNLFGFASNSSFEVRNASVASGSGSVNEDDGDITYTAPATPGTYVVTVTYRYRPTPSANRVTSTRNVTIKVG